MRSCAAKIDGPTVNERLNDNGYKTAASGVFIHIRRLFIHVFVGANVVF